MRGFLESALGIMLREGKRRKQDQAARPQSVGWAQGQGYKPWGDDLPKTKPGREVATP